jgi:cytochrome c oxidase subunit 2
VDAIYFALVTFSGFFTILIAGLILFFAIRYRRRSETETPPEVKPSMKLEVVWTAIPTVIALGIYAWGAAVYFDMVTPPNDALQVYVIGKQWMWHTQHLGGQREINELHVPVGRPIKLTMASQDVIHNFSIPDFRIRRDVIPGRYTTLWFTPTKVDKFRFWCAEYCGTNHSRMVGWVHVMEPAQFQSWLALRADGSLATEGRKLFYELQCISCHTGDARGRGPALANIHGQRVPLADGTTIVADDSYLRESILNPDARLVAGFQPIMPSFAGQVSEREIVQLIGFMRSLSH